MTTTDYAINIALVGLVLLQVRPRQMTLRSLVLPVAGVAAAASYYLKGVPTAGNDLVLVAALAAAGALLGALAGLFTAVWREGGNAWSKAGPVAAALWVVGIGSRLVFEEYVTHGGERAVASFSAAHQITGAEAWTAALVLMALAEVVVRLVVLRLRGHLAAEPTPAGASLRSA